MPGAGTEIGWSRRTLRIWHGDCRGVRFIAMRLSVRGYMLAISAVSPPRWVVWTLASAQQRAQQIADSPPVDPFGECWPVVHLREPYRRLARQPRGCQAPRRCPRCGSRQRPEAVRPIAFTREFWRSSDDVWRCPRCSLLLGPIHYEQWV